VKGIVPSLENIFQRDPSSRLPIASIPEGLAGPRHVNVRDGGGSCISLGVNAGNGRPLLPIRLGVDETSVRVLAHPGVAARH
jgi:hypothetical protein